VNYDELLNKITYERKFDEGLSNNALRAVVELHKPDLIPDWVPTDNEYMCWCAHVYPCPTIQVIEKELT
jgi:hypothetical protein